MVQLKIIVGSTRQGRAADLFLPWLLGRARGHGGFDVDLLDLRDWPLPFFAETRATVGNPADPTYSQPVVKAWNQKMADADAILFVTPEYNHSIPGVLKNALDSVFASYALRNKVAAFVGYSGGAVAGARAVEHLVQICFESEMVTLRDCLLVPRVHDAFDADHAPRDPAAQASLDVLLDNLAWWGALLKKGRETQLPPGRVRLGRALSARTQPAPVTNR
jgi:NAD(P)H-dependent FMN reductase